MRISYVTETWPPEINGVSLTVERCVHYLRERGHQVELIRPRQRGEAPADGADEWRTAGLPIPLYPDLRLGLATVPTLRRRFAASRPDLVHVATPGPLGRAAMVAASRLHLPLTADFRTNFHCYSRYYWLGWLEPFVCRYLRRLHNRADCNFVPLRSLARELAAQGFARTEVVGRGVDTVRFAPTKRSAALRAAWGVDDQQLVMLYVGRLAREKNVALALHAFNMVRYLRPRTRMVVVGDGPLRRRLEGEFPAAQFVGCLRDEALAQAYASADLFVFPSETETFGNVTLEALASGLPVVGFDHAAVGEYVRHGGNGAVAPRGDESAFIRTVCRTVARDDLLPSMGAQARRTALDARWDVVLARLEQLFERTLSQHRTEQARDVVLA
jgi:glycosyltransferase involved in cell wall biosynthesis